MANKPLITIKNNAQKGGYTFSDILTKDILLDVCARITGQEEYTVSFDGTGYNKGRLALIEYAGKTTYVSFSEPGLATQALILAGRTS
ncbi:MAG: hypothetical protein LBG05_07265 [Treponema sp.]|jgi:hypothetical protein|nr:hypothetical protein [Treponema sp.]